MNTARSKRGKLVLIVGCAGGAALAVGFVLSSSRPPPRPSPPPSPEVREVRVPPRPAIRSPGPSDARAEMERIEKMDSPLRRAEARAALLFDWTSRDLAGVARWFATLEPSHDLRREGGRQLVAALLECDPADVVAALRAALPRPTARELLGLYFRAWGAVEPAAAAGMLADIAATEPREPAPWHDLAAQIAAGWIETDSAAALAWVRALPAGAGKTAALRQIGYRWTELEPSAAAACAAASEDTGLIRIVAGKWAEISPAAALAWARALPPGTLQDEAVAAATAIRDQRKAPDGGRD